MLCKLLIFRGGAGGFACDLRFRSLFQHPVRGFLISASAVIVPSLVLAEVDYFLRAERMVMRKLIAEIFDPATRYEYELPVPSDIARALELDARFGQLRAGTRRWDSGRDRRAPPRLPRPDLRPARDFSAIRVGPRLTRALELLP